MRILQVITTTDRRGGQVFGVDLGDALAARGHDVDTVALAPGSGSTVVDVPVLGSTRLGRSTLAALRRRMRSVDVVVAHGSTTLPACAIAGFGVRTPFVYRQIGNSRYWAPTVAKRLRVGVQLRRTAAVVALSPAAKELLVEWFKVPRGRIHVAPNGVSGVRFAPATDEQRAETRRSFRLDPGAPVVLYVGSLERFKGVDQVLKAAGAAGGAAQVLVVGEGPERAELEALADRVVPGAVVFTGLLGDVVPAYHAADLVVLPFTGADSMPATVVEGGMCGLPVVTTPVGAIPEVVDGGATGVLVPAHDQPALDEAVASLLADPDRAAAIGATARERYLQRYDLPVVAKAWEIALQAALARAGS